MVVNTETGVTVCAIIVTYYPDRSRLEKLLKTLVNQTAAIIIVDNNSDTNFQSYLKENQHIVQVISLQKNMGVATAQNTGIKAAIDKGYEYVLLLDQDSVPHEHMVSLLYEAYSSLKESGQLVSGVGPAYTNPRSVKDPHFLVSGILGYRKRYCDPHKHRQYVHVKCLISSGSLVETSVIQRIGYMEEGLFIDHVDTEWFLRAGSLGYAAYGVCAAELEHTLGAAAIKFWLFGVRTKIVHQPFRYYYMFRNSAVLYRRPYVPFNWKVADFLSRVKTVIFLLLFSEDRTKNLKYIKSGIFDGLKGRLGPIS